MSVHTPTSNLFPERLYLSKGGDGDIYLNNCQNLRKNQIDCLRGLYKIFKKKNPGVILNDASDSGKTVLVSLFISSIQGSLDNPVLILCNHNHEIEYWKEILLTWTTISEDNIAINSTNPYLKKDIFIQSMELSSSFFRRCWSILILKNNEITKEVGKLVFDAAFKMWITSVDVFRDLNMLSSVGKFINPNMKINTTDFEITADMKLSEKIKIVALLESFTKNFVVRTEHLKSILQITNNTDKTVTNTNTRKNKDATGTKIKKSKKKLCDDEQNKTNKKSFANKIETKYKHDDADDATEQDSLSLIDFKSHEETLQLKNNEYKIEMNDIDMHEVTNNDNNNYDKDDVLNNDDNNIETDKYNKMVEDEDSTQSLTGIRQSVTKLQDKTHSQINMDNIVMGNSKIKLDLRNSNYTNQINNEIETGNKINETDTILSNSETSQIKLCYTEDVDMETGEVYNGATNERENEMDKTSNKNIVKTDKIGLTNEIIENSNTVANAQVTENVNDTIDKKINDLEMKTLMKFKGSILDSIF